MANNKKFIVFYIFLLGGLVPFYALNAESNEELDKKLITLTKKYGLTGNPVRNHKLPDINYSRVAQLGRELFFSKSLSLDFDIACASCHHPQLAGGDSLSLPVGVGAIDMDLVGPGRLHNGDYHVDPEADGGPNVERNSPSTFNTAFYQHALFYDGRVEAIKWQDGAYIAQRVIQENKGLLSKDTSLSEKKVLFKTPDSIFRGPDTLAGDNLLQAQARFPVIAAAEMRGFSSHFGGNSAVRLYLEKRFQGKTGELKNTDWEQRFRKAFDQPSQPIEELITFNKIAIALAEYQRSQVFVNNPWKGYLSGKGHISEAAKRGAVLFYSGVNNGGANCVACHSGDFFTNENYYNLAIPQFGRGNFVYGQDLGRHPVTRADKDLFAFRVPTLLNVSETAPYGHTGAFIDLYSVIKHHLTPEKSIDSFDFTLQHLPQFKGLNVKYPEARANTIAALKQKRAAGIEKMPLLNNGSISDIIEFLKTLTDPCVVDHSCLKSWLPDGKPADSHRLEANITNVFDNSKTKFNLNVLKFDEKEEVIASFVQKTDYQPVCNLTDQKYIGKGFTNVTTGSLLDVNRQFDFNKLKPSLTDDGLVVMEHLLFSGGVAAGDINGDCFSDLVINQGNAAGAKVFLNKGDGKFQPAENNWGIDAFDDITGPMLVDLNGDGWLDLFHGNIYGSAPGVLLNDGQRFIRVTRPGFRVGHVTIGAGFGDVNGDGYLDAFLAHWARPSKAEEEHLWLNRGNGLFKPGARQFGLTGHFGERDFTFTPNFPDLNNDGKSDLISTADFMTSQVFVNKDNTRLMNVTDKQVITDQNGMGAAIADFDNDGDLDWFVTSIYSSPVEGANQPSEYMAAIADGNRLYRNDGQGKEKITFSDVTDRAGIREGGWGWGACAADFNNDGWIDIFHTNGFPLDPSEVRKDLHYLFPILKIEGFHDVLPYDTFDEFRDSIKVKLSAVQQEDLEPLYYIGKKLDNLFVRGQALDNRSKLFINNRDGSFSEMSDKYAIADPGQGRGISCLDYDRDGDIDILIVNNQGEASLYRNNFGNKNNFLTVKLLDKAPNIHAVGARIYIESASGKQMREVMVENNYISQNPIESHFGLGKDTIVNSLTVVWPDGVVENKKQINSKQILLIHKP